MTQKEITQNDITRIQITGMRIAKLIIAVLLFGFGGWLIHYTGWNFGCALFSTISMEDKVSMGEVIERIPYLLLEYIVATIGCVYLIAGMKKGSLKDVKPFWGRGLGFLNVLAWATFFSLFLTMFLTFVAEGVEENMVAFRILKGVVFGLSSGLVSGVTVGFCSEFGKLFAETS